MDNLIQQIKEVDLVEIFSDLGFQVVKRKLKCPFHDDKTPSMMVYPENWYHCFGCGKHGDVFNFYQQYFDLDFKHALMQLATRYVPSYTGYAPKQSFKNPTFKKNPKDLLPILKPTETPIHSEIYEAFRGFCVNQAANEISKKALEYLYGRGFDDRIIREFKLFVVKNYADTNDFLRNHFPLADLKESGLFNERGNLIFFKHPLIIPYIKAERIVYLQGRSIGNDDELASKYQFLSGVPRSIFNVDVLKKLKLNQKIYLTEGAFDCMTLAKKGYPALSLGSAKTFKKEWAKLFKRYEAVVFFDNDSAGVQGGLDLLETLTLAGINAYRKYLPPGYKDINEYFQANEQF
jgi:DNA primase